MSDTSSPAASSALRLAGTGPVPMMLGSTPAKPMERMVASASIPRASATSLAISTSAVAPALSGEALPG